MQQKHSFVYKPGLNVCKRGYKYNDSDVQHTEYTLKSTLLIDKLLQTFPAVPVTLCTLIFVQLHLLVLCDLVFQWLISCWVPTCFWSQSKRSHSPCCWQLRLPVIPALLVLTCLSGNVFAPFRFIKNLICSWGQKPISLWAVCQCLLICCCLLFTVWGAFALISRA